MSTRATIYQEENRTKAAALSALFHIALLALLFFYRFHASEPVTEPMIVVPLDMGGGGDNAAAGEPDRGQGNNPAPQGQQMDDPSSRTPVDEPSEAPQPSTPPPSKPTTSTPSSTVPNNTPTSTDPDVAALRKQREDQARQQREEQARQQAERDRIAAADRQRQADEAARKQREQDEYNKKKGAFGSTFGSGNGGGRGNTGTPGNQGVPGGTGDNPFGKSPGTGGGTGGGTGTGSGDGIGGGLRGRSVVQRPRPDCEGKGSGKVIVEVTVDASGRVTSARATQRGSTLVDSQSRSCAERTAKRFVFAPAQASAQSGTIQVNFGYSQGQ